MSNNVAFKRSNVIRSFFKQYDFKVSQIRFAERIVCIQPIWVFFDDVATALNHDDNIYRKVCRSKRLRMVKISRTICWNFWPMAALNYRIAEQQNRLSLLTSAAKTSQVYLEYVFKQIEQRNNIDADKTLP